MSIGRYFVLDLGTEDRHGYVVGGKLPNSDLAYSPLLDIGFNRQKFSWYDENPHLHENCEEYFIVLKGSLHFLIENKSVTVNHHELIGIHAGVSHQIVGGDPPVENFLIRIPGGMNDKVVLDSLRSIPHVSKQAGNFIHVDLLQPHTDYLVGACLSTSHTNYSPLLDLTCVWGVDPQVEWQHEKLHFHNQREEFYFILNGELNFEVDGSLVSLSTGQILGVRPGVVHKVAGGRNSVDVLFVRVPGGRSDKVIVE